MKTNGNIKTDFYRIIVSSPIRDAISGDIIRDKRTDGSNKEDCVVSVLTGNTEQIQDGIVNVNICVQDVVNDGMMREDERRSIQLQELCADVFGDKAHPRYDNGKGIIYWIERQSVLPVDGKDEHVINNRVHYRFNNE